MKWFLLLVPPVLMYLIGAFIGWQFDPGQWDTGGRLFAAGATMLLEFLVLGVISET